MNEQNAKITKVPPFKQCPMCEKEWSSREVFLADIDVHFNGYQPNFGLLDEGLFYFTHERKDCGSTMLLAAGQFLSLYSGKKYEGSMWQTTECSGLCLDKSRLERCDVPCKNAIVREVTQLIKDRFQQTASSPLPQ